MGTNYDLQFHFCLKCKRKDEIHLGKSSGGWVFGLQYNDGKYYKNWEEMKEFLAKTEGQIIDEYGDKISLDDFIKLVESKQKEPHTHLGLDNRFTIDENGYEFFNGEFS